MSYPESISFRTIRTLLRRDFADYESFEEAIDDAIREDNPWAILKTDPNTDQWIVDVVRGDPACYCAFAYSVELLDRIVDLPTPSRMGMTGEAG